MNRVKRNTSRWYHKEKFKIALYEIKIIETLVKKFTGQRK
jgi:hypothetical protein